MNDHMHAIKLVNKKLIPIINTTGKVNIIFEVTDSSAKKEACTFILVASL